MTLYRGEIMQIVAQVLGALGIISMVLSVQFNSKKQVLGFQIAANSLFAFQYLCLNAISAVVMSFVAVLRCVVFFVFENKSDSFGLSFGFIWKLFFI